MTTSEAVKQYAGIRSAAEIAAALGIKTKSVTKTASLMGVSLVVTGRRAWREGPASIDRFLRRSA